MRTINILIVDDHQMMREGLLQIINNHEHTGYVDSVATAVEAIEIFGLQNYDVVLLDINLPDMDGITLCAKLIKRKPSQHIIALSQHDELGVMLRMFAAGAKGYVVKTSGVDIIFRAVAEVMKGNIYYPHEIKNNLHEPKVQNYTHYGFSTREYEIIMLISQGYSVKQISLGLNLSIRTIEWHKSNIMRKMGTHNTIEMLKLFKEMQL